MAAGTSVLDSKMAAGPGRLGVLIGVVVLLIGLVYIGRHLLTDLSGVHAESWLPYALLGVALLTALASYQVGQPDVDAFRSGRQPGGRAATSSAVCTDGGGGD